MHCSADEPDDLAAVRKTALPFLGKNNPSVNSNFKNTIGPGDQLHRDIRPQQLFQFIPQTGGTGLIISPAAVFNGNFFHDHPSFISQ